MSELLDYTERRTRAEIAALPHGVYEAEGTVDVDGYTDEPVLLKARIEIGADGVSFDLTGSDPQRRAPVNSTYAQTFSACAYAVKCLIDPDLPVNDGFYRVVSLDAPQGTVTNCTWPSPVVGGWETQTRLVDVIFRALLPALPERLPAGTKAMMCHAGFGGVDRADERVLLLPRDVRRRLRRPLRERRAGRGADARAEHRERAGRGDRAELSGPDRASLARRGLGRAGSLPRRPRPAEGLRLRPRDDVHGPRRPHARGAGGRVRRPAREARGVRADPRRRRDAARREDDDRGRAGRHGQLPHLRRRRLRPARRSATASSSRATCARGRSASSARARSTDGGRRPDLLRGDPERARRGDRRDGARAEAERLLDEHQDALRLLVRVLRRAAALGRAGVRAARAPRLDGRAGAEGGPELRRREPRRRATCSSRTTRTRAAST